MATFERRTLRINGIDTVLLEAGSGPIGTMLLP